MQTFLDPFLQLKEFEDIKYQLKKNRGILQISGCIDSQKEHLIYGLSREFANRVIITYSDQKAKEIYEDYRFFDRNVLLYPARDLMFYQADIHSNLLVKQRMEVIQALLTRQDVTVVTTVDACMEHVLPLNAFKEQVIRIQDTGQLDLDELKARLVSLGYERTAQVEGSGQFAVRGGIIDIFPLTEENPLRIELWDEEVDSIRSFDVESQRSIENLPEVLIYPATELILTEDRKAAGLKAIEKDSKNYEAVLRKQMKTEEAHRIHTALETLREELDNVNGNTGVDSYIRYFYDDTVCFLDYFEDPKTLFCLDEPARLTEKGGAVEFEFQESMMTRLEKGYVLPGQVNVLLRFEEFLAKVHGRNSVALCMLDQKVEQFKFSRKYYFEVKSVNPYNNSFELLIKDLKQWKKNGCRVCLMAASRTRARRLAEDFREYEINSFYTEDLDRPIAPGEVMVVYGQVHRGYEYPLIKFVVISETDIFGKEKRKKKKHTTYEGQKIQSFSDLSVGDYVVHENHGLGIYRGIEKVEVDRVEKDYIKIEYASGGNLYILATQLDLIQKYAGADAKKPKLNKLGTQEWSKTKTRVRGAVREIARDLVELYAARQEKEGYCYGQDTVWQKEFEEMFPFEETEDQLLAIEATKRDMESKKIMDRLICGDVGYGKTEIALRAAFKAVQEGKQVVYLVPTTILAQQHYATFTQRMKDFPVRVDLMSRFRTPAQQKNTIQDLKKGFVDIVIGTHRVLSADLAFKDLGLLIVDEEQRFGVAHKEKIKKLKENIDVLTLTATPIPRTLHMSLIGIRDMSVLEEPPMDRIPIQTYVMEYNEEMVREAINRELARGGQVYYVYNRVNTIDEVTNQVAGLVPEANVAFAHGQMKEHELERIMFDFINGEIDVLVSTTIIETGLDIPNVNTMIIHDADNMGLSQLYQLRGRVGRSNRTAYAFLMYRRNKMLKEVAEKRLHAIREFTELGSGFKIAMRDLEIRGAGNLLGAEQHGHMEAVGYDLYCKMLNEAVKQVKGTQPEESYDTAIDLDVDAFIPPTYIRSEFQKLDIYKRIAGVENSEECEDILEELIDRFGEPPKSVQNLLEIARLKALARSVYVIDIAQRGDEIRFTMYEKAHVDPARIPALLEKEKQSLKFTVETNPYFTYRRVNSRNEDVFTIVKNILNEIKALLI